MTALEFFDLTALRADMSPQARRVLDRLLTVRHAALESDPNYTDRFDDLPDIEQAAITYFLEVAASYRWPPAVEMYSRFEERAWTPRPDSRAQWELEATR